MDDLSTVIRHSLHLMGVHDVRFFPDYTHEEPAQEADHGQKGKYKTDELKAQATEQHYGKKDKGKKTEKPAEQEQKRHEAGGKEKKDKGKKQGPQAEPKEDIVKSNSDEKEQKTTKKEEIYPAFVQELPRIQPIYEGLSFAQFRAKYPTFTVQHLAALEKQQSKTLTTMQTLVLQSSALCQRFGIDPSALRSSAKIAPAKIDSLSKSASTADNLASRQEAILNQFKELDAKTTSVAELFISKGAEPNQFLLGSSSSVTPASSNTSSTSSSSKKSKREQQLKEATQGGLRKDRSSKPVASAESTEPATVASAYISALTAPASGTKKSKQSNQ